MIKAIFWKEWRRSRWLFIALLLAAILIPAVPGQIFPNEGRTAREILRVIWVVFCILAAAPIFERKGPSAISFLLARPATKPFLFGVEHLSYLIMLAGFIFISLTVHCLHMVLRFPELSPLDILLDPELLFGFALCLFLIAGLPFLGDTIRTFGGTMVGIGFFVILAISLIFNKQLVTLASRFPDLSFREAPLTCLLLLLCGTVFFSTISLWEIAFDEIRDARNRRWIHTVALATALSLILLCVSGLLAARTRLNRSGMIFSEVMVTFRSYRPIACAISDDSEEGRLIDIRAKPYYVHGKFMRKETDPPQQIQDLHVSGTDFIPVSGWNAYVYFSNKPIMGTEIRSVTEASKYTIGLHQIDEDTISPRYYSRKEILSPPFLSPDKDRVAYLRESKSRFGGQASYSLWITITKFGRSGVSLPISDYADLPAGEGTDWAPIGWTPDGYDFLLKKMGSDGSEIWAVDWVARGPRRFLEDFPGAVITQDDLPPHGEWVSLMKKEPDGTWTAHLVKYRSGESKNLGVFKQEPLRAWNTSGTLLAFWEPSSETLSQYAVWSDGPKGPGEPIYIPSVSQMRFPPQFRPFIQSHLALVISDPKPRLVRMNSLTAKKVELITVAAKFTGTKEQWDWLENDVIIYADGPELWQVEPDGTRTLILSLYSLSHEE